MAGVMQNLFGGAAPSGAVKGDDDFADFSNPSPAAAVAGAVPVTGAGDVQQLTAWYRVWERVSPSDFIQEAFVLPFIFVLLAFHFWGSRKNKSKAKAWAAAHAPMLESEFAVVGYGGVPRSAPADPEKLVMEKSKQEYQSYATGRENVAFLDVSIKLVKRYNPVIFVMDNALGLFMDSFPPPVERVVSTLYSFDGKEKEVVPVPRGTSFTAKVSNSTYDGFIWAVVHKNVMRRLRQDRYDISMTFTKDNAKLPNWATVMTESAEISDLLLTPELIKAIEEAGDAFEYLIISDQPVDKPTKIEEIQNPRKRVQLSLQIPSSGYESTTLSLYGLFLRIPDTLVSGAHFRPEVSRKLRNTREEEIRKLRKIDEEEKAEERKYAAEKIKKEERERLLRGMTAEDQKKYLEREKEKEQRKMMKRSTRRG